MFIRIEDETGVANLVIWPQLFEKQRRVILTAGMLAADGRVQREGEVVHIVACRLHDLSNALVSIDDREAAFPLPHAEVTSSTAAAQGKIHGICRRDVQSRGTSTFRSCHWRQSGVRRRDFR